MLADTAARLGGRVDPGGFFGAPSVAFRLRGRDAILGGPSFSRSDDAGAGLRLTVDLRGRSPGALKIHPEGFAFPLARLFGAQDLRIGDARFDALYVVKSNPESLVRAMFESGRREALIESVRAIGQYVGPVVDLSRERLLVALDEAVPSDTILGRMVRTAEEFTAAILEVETSRPVFWEEVLSSSEGRCPVCASPFGGRTTRCAKCATPHHRDCWDYAGGCSTYACGGTRPA